MSDVLKKICSVSLFAILNGCGTTSSGVMPVGPDTYQVAASTSANMHGNPSEARRLALQQASEQCNSNAKELIVTNTTAGISGLHYVVTVTFRCLYKGDKDLSRPDFRNTPDIVIENRK